MSTPTHLESKGAELERAVLELHQGYLREREQALPRLLKRVLESACGVAQSQEAFVGELVSTATGGTALRTWAQVGASWAQGVFACTPIDSESGSVVPAGPFEILSQALAAKTPVWVNVPVVDLQVRGRLPPVQRWLPNLLAIPCGTEKVSGICAFSHRTGAFDSAVVRDLAVLVESVAAIFEALQREREQRKSHQEAKDALQCVQTRCNRKYDALLVMSREIRTPLNGVLGLTHLLATDRPAEHQRSNLESLTFAASSLLQLVNDTLDFSTLESGEFELQEAPVELQPLLEELIRSHRTMASGRGLELVLETENLPASCIVDQVRLMQILANLTHNALKFTARGIVTVSAKAADGQISFAVEDTGSGIPQEKQEEIFESFANHTPGARAQYCGTGFGLAICRRLTRCLGGELRLHSSVGEGSRFWFSLPLRVATPVTPEPPASSGKPPAGTRVLLIDDVPLNLKVAGRILESFGARVDTAISGYEALQALSSATYDVILLDLHMPDMDGFETSKHIFARGYTTPVYALSADILSRTVSRVQAAGMRGLLPKPTPPGLLRELVERHAAVAAE